MKDSVKIKVNEKVVPVKYGTAFLQTPSETTHSKNVKELLLTKHKRHTSILINKIMI